MAWTTYDTSGLYPIRILGEHTRTIEIAYYPAAGMPRQMTDTNKAVTEFVYDDFGQLTMVV